MIFPNGWEHYLLGGILIGLAGSFLYVVTGYIIGASTSLQGLANIILQKKEKYNWHRASLFFGIVLGAFIFAYATQSFWQTQVSWWRLLIGGFFVGLGATMARGCTSGHGICGVASGSKTSILYVAIFMIVAICTAFVMSMLGVMP